MLPQKRKMARRLHAVILLCREEVDELIRCYHLPHYSHIDIYASKGCLKDPLNLIQDLESDRKLTIIIPTEDFMDAILLENRREALEDFDMIISRILAVADKDKVMMPSTSIPWLLVLVASYHCQSFTSPCGLDLYFPSNVGSIPPLSLFDFDDKLPPQMSIIETEVERYETHWDTMKNAYRSSDDEISESSSSLISICAQNPNPTIPERDNHHGFGEESSEDDFCSKNSKPTRKRKGESREDDEDQSPENSSSSFLW